MKRASSSATHWSTTRRWACRSTEWAVAVVYDPKDGFTFKVGFQQSNTDATSLNESMFTLSGKSDTSPDFPDWAKATIVSGTERTTPSGGGLQHWHTAPASTRSSVPRSDSVRAVWRVAGGSRERDHFYSGGLPVRSRTWILPRRRLGSRLRSVRYCRSAGKERLVEGYYNFSLTEKLNVLVPRPALSGNCGRALRKLGYLVPGVRLQASF